jgi:hypothetical protein
MGYDTLEIIMEGIKTNQLAGGTIYAVEARTVLTQKLSVIILTMEAALTPPGDPDGGDIQTPLKTVKGSRKVEDEETQEPIFGATVLLYWSDAGGTDETVTANTEGIFYFTRGIVGSICRIHITHPDYEDKDSTITIPGDLPTDNVSPTDPTIPKETYQTCTFDIDVPYWFK